MKTEAEIIARVDAILADHPFGRPSAAKRGRNPEFPWVPIIDYGDQKIGSHVTRTSQICGRAYRTRDEAVDYALLAIKHATEHLRSQLLDPRFRALREQYGLPREFGGSAHG